MESKELMARCENALRTGQTENLYPVLAAAALKQIRADIRDNRIEWEKLSERQARRVNNIRLREGLDQIGRTFNELETRLSKALGIFVSAFQSPPKQSDYALCPSPRFTAPNQALRTELK